jgi:hypothetical protein
MLQNSDCNNHKLDKKEKINHSNENEKDEFEDEFEIVQDEDENDSRIWDRHFLNKEALLKPFGCDSLQLYLNQDINEIRKEPEPFCDSQFKPSLNQIVKNSSSKLAEYLFMALGISIPEVNEMNGRIKWNRCKVCFFIIFRSAF